MLKNAYLDAKIVFDTAANELSKVGCAANFRELAEAAQLAAQLAETQLADAEVLEPGGLAERAVRRNDDRPHRQRRTSTTPQGSFLSPPKLHYSVMRMYSPVKKKRISVVQHAVSLMIMPFSDMQ